jgi:class 3 adenylate cyclase
MRVERAFGFVDLCGFTEFTDRHDDASVVVVLASLRTALREAAARRGVRVVKWLGDGAMLSSTMPDALVALAIEIDERMAEEAPPLPVRIGLAHGPVIMFEGDDYIGRAVNLASRLCDRAEPREILAAGMMAACGPAWVAAVPVGPAEVRGFRDPLDAFRLRLADTSAGAIVDPVCGLTIPLAAAVAGTDGTSFCSVACAEAERDPTGVDDLRPTLRPS